MEKEGDKKISECLWFYMMVNAHHPVPEILQLCPHLPFQAEIRMDNHYHHLKTLLCNWPLKVLYTQI